jgi:pimeloyl-ACP methyl ester carboxylesterase
VYDRLGFGRSSPFASPWTVQYMHRSALIELPAVLSRLVPHEDYVLYGHSDGGSIGLLHASERPPRLRGLITEAAHVLVEKKTLAGIRGVLEAYDAGKLRWLASYRGDQIEDVFRMWADTWLSDWFRSWNIEDVLPSIECPVLVIQGTDDRYATVAQVEAIVSRIANARRAMVARCDHAPHREKTGIVLRLGAEFVNALT